MSSSLKNIKISDSYPRLVQQIDGIFYDGAGNRIPGIGGPQGPQGVGSSGTQGPQGFQGIPGDTGSGIQGNQGFQGPDGANGTNALWNFSNMWSSGVVYVIGDVVTYAGQTWYCISQTTAGQGPFDGNIDTYWQLLAAKGATGSPGNGNLSVWISSESPEVPGNFWVVEPAPGPGQASIQINVIDAYGNDQTGMLTTISGLTPASIPTIFTITDGALTLSILVTSSTPAALVGTWLINGNIIAQDTLTGPSPYAVSYSVTGPITSPLNFTQGSQIESIPNSSGDGLNATTMALKPDSSLTTDQYIVLDPTSPNHIHIRAGGNIDNSLTDIFVGGEENNLRVSDDQNYSELNSYRIVNIDAFAIPNQDTIGVPFTHANWYTESGYYIKIDEPSLELYNIFSAFTYPSTLSVVYATFDGALETVVNVNNIDLTTYPSNITLSVNEIPPFEPTEIGQFIFEINEGLRSKVTAIANTGVVNIWTGNYNNPAVWTFGATGGLTFPDNSIQTVAYPGIPTLISSGNSAPGSVVVANETNVNINFSDGVGTAWSFDTEHLVFPDGTAQRTAYIPKYKVFTALLNQSGPDDEQQLYPPYLGGSNLTVGVTYMLDAPILGDDFRNVGGPLITYNNEFQGYYFIATGTTPTDWTNRTSLIFNSGAPVATVLENTIGNIWFNYGDVGYYTINADALFTVDKSWTPTIQIFNDTAGLRDGEICEIRQGNSNKYFITTFDQSSAPLNYKLSNTPIEIRVYN